MPEFDVSTLTAQFHWLRPLWLLGIPLVLVLGIYLLRGQAQQSQWQQLINPQLLPHLLQDRLSRQQRWPLVALISALIIALIAMAGPSWEKLPQPIHKAESALVILYDMSPSMMAEDLKPSRLTRSRLKLVDLLNQRSEGQTALIAYAGESHTVTPLTDDTETIISLLPALSPAVMPMGGSNTEMAFDQALTLFKDSGVTEGDILLVTDEVAIDAQQYLRRKLPLGFRLSILGIGTEAGAPIPARHGGFVRDNNGGIVLAKLNVRELNELASKSGGVYRTLSHDDSDIKALLPKPDLLNANTRELEREFDTWLDRGAWLVLLLIPFAAFSFRRGWLLLAPLLLILPEPGYAFGWKDLWQTPDQQGLELLQQNNPGAAAETFKREDWKAAAQYRAEDYAAAAAAFARENSASGYYNAGNALAKSGKLQEAINAYDEALQRQPDMEDAQHNKALVEKLLQQQQNDPSSQNAPEQNNQGDQQPQGSSGDNDASPPEPQNADQDNANSDGAGNQDPNDQPHNSDNDPSADGNENQHNGSGEQDSGESGEQASPPRDSDSPAPPEQQGEPQQQGGSETGAESNREPPAEQQPQPPRSGQPAADGELSDEEQQAMEQWLRQIPDDPSGLMRKKFEYQYRQRLLESQRGYWQPPNNQANERW